MVLQGEGRDWENLSISDGLRRPRRHPPTAYNSAPAGVSMPLRGIMAMYHYVELTRRGDSRMDYSEVFLRQHDEMCQVVGSIVFSLVEAGHDSTSENIVAVLRNGIAESGKWEPDQVLYGVRLENGIYGHSRFCNTDFDDKLACLNLSGV